MKRRCLRWTRSAIACLAMWMAGVICWGQEESRRGSYLPEAFFKGGAETLKAFAAISAGARDSVVLLSVDGAARVFGTVVDSEGLVVTKASEVKEGKLMARLKGGSEAAAEVAAVDEENDLALVRLDATGLKGVEWRTGDVKLGQWVVTPGLEDSPEAVGIISAPPRTIPRRRALIGVVLDFEAPQARIREVMPGLGAEKAGLRAGDIILAAGTQPVERSQQLMDSLRRFREGHEIELRVKREGEEFAVTVRMMVPTLEQLGRGPGRQERMNRLGGELSARSEGFETVLQHDTVLAPGQCGGPLLDVEGRAVGVNIARAGRVASYALPAELVSRIIERLREPTLTREPLTD